MSLTAPLLVRISGLEASAVEPLASPLCGERAAAILAAERKLDEVRQQLVDRLYEEIHGAPAELRRLLLAVKRDSFNRRSIARHQAAPLWPDLCGRIGTLAGQAIALEHEVTEGWCALRRDFELEGERQARDLCRIALADKGLLRGIALAGPSMIEDLRRCCRPGRPAGRKQRKLAISLGRYVSRAALKLSPNSTLTRVALGTIEPKPAAALELLGCGWRERSLLRLRRMYIDQWRDMLLRHPAFRSSLPLAPNGSSQEVEPGRFRCLRPGFWEANAEGTDLRFVQDALVTAPFDSRLFHCAFRLLAEGSREVPDLLQALADETGIERPAAAAELERLLKLGFLRFRLPWTEDEAHVERRLFQHLRTIPQLEDIAGLLASLVELQQGYAGTDEPAQALQRMAELSAELTRRIGELAGLALHPVAEYRRGRFYEDVLLSRAPGNGSPDLVQVSRAAMERALASLEPMIGLAFLYSHRHDFLHALAELAARQFPHRETVGFLDLFAAARPLWREYSRFLADAMKNPEGWRASFNPYGLAALEEVDGLRQMVWNGLGSCVESVEHAEVLSGAALESLLAPVPERYAPLVGLCLFLQPLDDHGELWFLNRMHEGVGRYGSRFTSAMDDGARIRYTEHLASRAPFEVDGEPLELLDLLCSQGDTLNVHAPQTPRALDLSGNGNSPGAESLRLRDLRVELAGPRGLPWLVDAENRRFLPVHLGGASHAFMPVIVQFLSLFGPGEFRSVWPLRHPHLAGEAEILKRLMIGNVVFGRKRWSFPLNSIAERLTASDPEAYVAIQNLRLRHGIPERVFVAERVCHRVLADRFKPQYVDLRSPLSLPILRAAIETCNGMVSFEETLPTPETLPKDREGRRWGVELLLDSLALRPRRCENDTSSRKLLQPLASFSNLPPEPVTAHL